MTLTTTLTQAKGWCTLGGGGGSVIQLTKVQGKDGRKYAYKHVCACGNGDAKTRIRVISACMYVRAYFFLREKEVWCPTFNVTSFLFSPFFL